MTSSSQTTAKVPIDELRSTVDGRVITPSDIGYDETRKVFAGAIDRHPAVIVRPVNVKDVVAIVNIARESGLELAVRSGGHSSAGHSVTEGGIVLDLRDMKALDIDVEKKTAWAETGLTAGEYTTAAAEYGLATGFGDTGSVGLGGLTLGGGIGYLVRKHGLTIDNLLAAEIVTADGRVLMANEQAHQDLFWAIRGGGGNFGVATRFQFKLHEVGTILGGMLFLPATPEVIAGFIAEAEAAPDALSTIANIMPAPPMPFIPSEMHGQMLVMAMMVFTGNIEDGEKVIAPFRALAKPVADMVKPMKYPEMFTPEEGDYRPLAASHTMFVDKVDLGDARTIVDYLVSSDAPFRVVQLRVLGGAMARVPVEATAFAHRQARILVNLAAFYTGPDDKPVREAWVADFASALHQGNDGAYVNFMEDKGLEQVRTSAYPGSTWDRLAAIKAHYDPTNLFRLNQNVPPAGQ